MTTIPVVLIVEFNDLNSPLCQAYCVPIDTLSTIELNTLLAADHRMYSDFVREEAKDGLCERDPVHEAMRVIIRVREHIIGISKTVPMDFNVVHKVTFAYLNEYTWTR